MRGTSPRAPRSAHYAERVSDDLRRLYNRFERALDFAALSEERRTEHTLRLPREPLRARAELALALPHAKRLDRGALLKGVAAGAA